MQTPVTPGHCHSPDSHTTSGAEQACFEDSSELSPQSSVPSQTKDL